MSNKILKISQLQIQGLEDPIENAKLIKKNLVKTIKFNPDIICTPECSNIITNDKKKLIKDIPYASECPVLDLCQNFAKEHKQVINIGSLLLKTSKSKKFVNRSFIINQDGDIIKYYDKIHLFDVNINKDEKHKESDLFQKGKEVILSDILNTKIGLTICYDLRFPNLYRSLAKKNVEIILVPAAFTIPTGKDHWKTLVKARAIENTVFIIATGQCGSHHFNRKTYGHSLVVNPCG